MYFTFPSAALGNINLNAPGSNYAADFGKETTKQIALQIQKMIFDASPQDYMDLAILNMQKAENVKGDEFSYFEAPWQRKALVTPVLSSNITAATTQTIPVLNPTEAVVDTVIDYPTEVKGSITSVDVNSSTITVRSLTGQTLPALSSGSAYIFANSSSIDGDGTTNITQAYRLTDLIERYNYVQMFARRTDFGRMEMFKYQNLATTDYVTMNRTKMIEQFRTDLANSYWNGEKGEATLSNGTKVKTMSGLYPAMIKAGSYRSTASASNLLEAIKTAAFRSRYGTGNYVRFLYAVPELLDDIATEVKQPLIRYQAAGDNGADLQLDYISLGTSKLVMVPMQRFEAKSGCFPASFEKRIFILDQASIKPCVAWNYRIGKIGHRGENPNTLNNYSTEYIEGTLSMKFQNPLGSAIIDVQ